MKKFVSTLVAAGILTAFVAVMSVQAEEKAGAEHPAKEKPAKEAKAKVEQPPAVDMTLKGLVERTEKPGKEGKPAIVTYTLVDGDSKVMLPQAKKGKDGAQAYNLEEFVGMKVTVVGQGRETMKKDKKMVSLVKITSIAKIAEE